MLPTHSSAFQPSNLVPGDESKPRSRIRAQILHVIYVLFTLTFGVCLLVLPWQSIWDSNYLLYLYPQIRLVVANPFFKGAVLGLGIVNILIGSYEIAHFKGFSKSWISQ